MSLHVITSEQSERIARKIAAANRPEKRDYLAHYGWRWIGAALVALVVTVIASNSLEALTYYHANL